MYRIGIDLGGTFIKGGIVRNEKELIYKTKVETPKGRRPADVIKAIAALITSLKRRPEVKDEICQAIGIGSPGTVDSKTGVVLYSNNFEWYESVYLTDEIHKYHSEPVYITNDANAAALGEWLAGGAGKDKTTVLITLGTGVGSGMVIRGKLYEGEKPGAMEMGHMMIKSHGRKCTCGNRGCLESYVSVTALIKDAKKKSAKTDSLLVATLKKEGELSGKSVTDAVRAGDAVAIRVFNKYMEHLAEGLTGIINIFRPDEIYLGGGVCDSFDLMDEYLNNYVGKYSFGADKGYVAKIKRACCGNDAGIIGAAALHIK